MGHIHAEPGQYDFTASGFVVRTDLGEPKLMLHWHKKLAMFMQFGGHIELDENPWQALAHELEEESGYQLGQLKIVQPKQRPFPVHAKNLCPQPLYVRWHRFGDSDHYHTDIAFGFVADAPPAKNPKTGESRNFQFFTIGELQAPPANVHPGIAEMGIYLLSLDFEFWELVETDSYSRSFDASKG